MGLLPDFMSMAEERLERLRSLLLVMLFIKRSDAACSRLPRKLKLVAANFLLFIQCNTSKTSG